VSETDNTTEYVDDYDDDAVVLASPKGSRGLRAFLIGVIVAGLVVAAGAGGWAIRGNSSGSTGVPAAGSVDVGFAQDMSTHHTQAVTMAGYERDNTTNPSLKILAYDIETTQELQVGEMSGWLDTWNEPLSNQHEMAWMGHPSLGATGLMPGMATPAQMNRLDSLHGKAMDIYFLQLMIHHHQGGAEMIQYAIQHASEPYVRRLAGSMNGTQSDEIVQMEQLLRQLGGSPRPPPTE
jgi:uncharacterized protein (DUF305 family)